MGPKKAASQGRAKRSEGGPASRSKDDSGTRKRSAKTAPRRDEPGLRPKEVSPDDKKRPRVENGTKQTRKAEGEDGAKPQPPVDDAAETKDIAAHGTSPTVIVNRAPVLTLWVAVIASRQGFTWDEALTYGRYIAGVLAHSKGKSLGLYHDHEVTEEERQRRRDRDAASGVVRVSAFGMEVPTVAKKDGARCAWSNGSAVAPAPVLAYLRRAFGSDYDGVEEAMHELARAIPLETVDRACYPLYEHFRPEWRGWGEKGHLSVAEIRRLAQNDAWKQYAS